MLKKKLIFPVIGLFALVGFYFSTPAATSNYPLSEANNNIHDVESLRNGLNTFVKNCVACHSAQLIRYSRIGQDLELSESELDDYIFGDGFDQNSPIITRMNAEDAINLFGIAPPDLSLTAKVRGEDWIYTFLKSYYQDMNKKFHADNHLFVGTAMPNVLGHFQGIISQSGEVITPGILSETEFDTKIVDLVNFMSYIAEPIQATRIEYGVKVIIFLLFFLFIFFLLKREYWQDIKK